MENVTLSAPAMFADHHVLKVRQVLYALDGVEDVYASSAWHTVIINFDADKIDQAAIQDALSQAGYTPDQGTPMLAQEGDRMKDPAWETLGVRVRETNQADLDMSGEFRRY